MSETRRDAVIVVGGGPAGCLAAIRLARTGVAVRLIDRGRMPRMSGETLSPDGRRALSCAGLWQRLPSGIALRCDAIGTAWERSSLKLQSFVRNPYGPAWHIDRVRFDNWLISVAVAEGVNFVSTNAREIEKNARGWNVIANDGTMFTASYIMVATGRTSSFVTKFARRTRLDSLCSIGGFDITASTDTTLIVEAVSGGWWYSMPLPDGRLFAGWMTDAIGVEGRLRNAALASSLNETIHTRSRLKCLRSIVARAASSSVLESCVGDGWIAIGDAVLSRDPLSGDGIAAALWSGWHGAGVILAALDGDNSATIEIVERTKCEVKNYLRQRTFAYQMQHRWRNTTFWSRRSHHSAAVG